MKYQNCGEWDVINIRDKNYKFNRNEHEYEVLNLCRCEILKYLNGENIIRLRSIGIWNRFVRVELLYFVKKQEENGNRFTRVGF